MSDLRGVQLGLTGDINEKDDDVSRTVPKVDCSKLVLKLGLMIDHRQDVALEE